MTLKEYLESYDEPLNEGLGDKIKSGFKKIKEKIGKQKEKFKKILYVLMILISGFAAGKYGDGFVSTSIELKKAMQDNNAVETEISHLRNSLPIITKKRAFDEQMKNFEEKQDGKFNNYIMDILDFPASILDDEANIKKILKDWAENKNFDQMEQSLKNILKATRSVNNETRIYAEDIYRQLTRGNK